MCGPQVGNTGPHPVSVQIPCVARRRRSRELTESSKRLFVTGRKSWLDLQNALREQLQAELAWTEAQAVFEALRYRLALHAGVVFWRPAVEQP